MNTLEYILYTHIHIYVHTHIYTHTPHICKYKIVVTCKKHLSTGNCRHTKLEEVDTAFRQYVQKKLDKEGCLVMKAALLIREQSI